MVNHPCDTKMVSEFSQYLVLSELISAECLCMLKCEQPVTSYFLALLQSRKITSRTWFACLYNWRSENYKQQLGTVTLGWTEGEQKVQGQIKQNFLKTPWTIVLSLGKNLLLLKLASPS